jgi:hypothetical protein
MPNMLPVKRNFYQADFSFMSGILVLIEKRPNANRLKGSEIEEKVGVNIELNINPNFLFDLRELLTRFSWVPFNQNEYRSRIWVTGAGLFFVIGC